MLLLTAAVFALLKCQIFLSKGNGGGILKLTLLSFTLLFVICPALLSCVPVIG